VNVAESSAATRLPHRGVQCLFLPPGHLLGHDVHGERYWNARLTHDEVAAIRADKATPARQLAERHGVSVRTITSVRRGERWPTIDIGCDRAGAQDEESSRACSEANCALCGGRMNWFCLSLMELVEYAIAASPRLRLRLAMESSLTMTCSRTRSQVLSAIQIRSRSWTVVQGP
jgi:hypothetical protein